MSFASCLTHQGGGLPSVGIINRVSTFQNNLQSSVLRIIIKVIVIVRFVDFRRSSIERHDLRTCCWFKAIMQLQMCLLLDEVFCAWHFAVMLNAALLASQLRHVIMLSMCGLLYRVGCFTGLSLDKNSIASLRSLCNSPRRKQCHAPSNLTRAGEDIIPRAIFTNVILVNTEFDWLITLNSDHLNHFPSWGHQRYQTQ